MTPQEFVADGQKALSALTTAVKDFFEAHPEIESDAASALKDVANDAAPLADAAVEAETPPALADVIDIAIAKEQSDADEAAAKIQADAQTRIAALTAVKERLHAPETEPE
jgi:hypothetical protein